MSLSKNSKIFLAGHNGLVGSSILRYLKKKKYKKIITKNRKILDLSDQSKTEKFLKKIKPEFVIIAAAKVGGINANQKYKADFIYNNLSIQNNIFKACIKYNVREVMFLGSSCIYPKNANIPIKEDYILSGKLEKTNDAYAIAKIAGIKMCESYNLQHNTNYKCLMPTNTFGPNDNYDTFNSHFLPALIKKIYEIKKYNKSEIKLWGNGLAKREIIYVDDIADACVFFMKKKTKQFLINIGTGRDYTIKFYLELIAKIVLGNKKIKILYDRSKPNGVPRKVMDISLAKRYGWKSKISLKSSILSTYKSYLKELK